MSYSFKAVLVIANLSGLLQICLGVDLAAENIPAVDLSSLQEDPLQLNKAVLSSLPQYFGNIGPVLYDILTNENALGNEFARTSKLIAETIGANNYRNSVNEIVSLAQEIEFRERLLPLLDRVRDIGYEVTDASGTPRTETLGDAMEIIKNILQDPEAVAKLREKITTPREQQSVVRR